MMNKSAIYPYAYISNIIPRFNKEQAETLRLFLRKCLAESGRKAKDVDALLGTNGMAGHYFGASQWIFPTEEAYNKMREIMPGLPSIEECLQMVGVKVKAGFRIFHDKKQ